MPQTPHGYWAVEHRFHVQLTKRGLRWAHAVRAVALQAWILLCLKTQRQRWVRLWWIVCLSLQVMIAGNVYFSILSFVIPAKAGIHFDLSFWAKRRIQLNKKASSLPRTCSRIWGGCGTHFVQTVLAAYHLLAQASGAARGWKTMRRNAFQLLRPTS